MCKLVKSRLGLRRSNLQIIIALVLPLSSLYLGWSSPSHLMKG